ncbi:expressed unknown protein [Seminavis robusta]|uniref:Uncharacterized protein n=1 Tax=Seminavis robusta TaxID=568900 RepID=A0A9N8EUQ0_9STRA|nr:expressed unknown protein [Seminavis robusta]|eukprot:Sro1743_g294800.1 n/a (256) ;mRNA; r:13565-14521
MIDLRTQVLPHQARQRVPAVVGQRWKHWQFTSSFCGCAFPTAVFAGGLCSRCGFTSVSKAIAAIAKEEKCEMRKKSDGECGVDTDNVIGSATAPPCATINTATKNDKPLYLSVLRGSEEELWHGYAPELAHSSYQPQALVDDTSGTNTNKTKPIAIPKAVYQSQQYVEDRVAAMEFLALKERYDRATWRLYGLIAKHRQERGVVMGEVEPPNDCSVRECKMVGSYQDEFGGTELNQAAREQADVYCDDGIFELEL